MSDQLKSLTRRVLTTLIDREEVMRFLAVCEATSLAGLLVGIPGTGKTKSVTDYAKAYYREPGIDEKEVNRRTLADTFILEVDEGSRPAEIKGRLNLKELLVNNDYQMISPIASSRYILINEIDKTTPALRNSLLGVMNEKFLFNGQEKVKCKWDVFLATCNKIPAEEAGNPFWDRFVLKMEVKRISKGNMLKFYANQANKVPPKMLDIKIPSKQELTQIKIQDEHMAKFMDTCYSKLSDRTLSYVPRIVAAITYVYKMPVTRALVKCAEMLVDFNTGKALSAMLEPKEVTDIRTKIEMVGALTDRTSLQTTLTDIQNGINNLIQKNIVGQDTVQELMDEVAVAMSNNPIVKQNPTANPFQSTPSATGANTATAAVPQASAIMTNSGGTLIAQQVSTYNNGVQQAVDPMFNLDSAFAYADAGAQLVN